MSDQDSANYKYWAFISYSHRDNLAVRGNGSGDHIQWANWLHEQLETFRVPDGCRDRPAATGEPMPEHFFPAFRDAAELPTSHDLGGQIHDALRRSRFLIVIASPRSAASRYVNEEVRYFRQLGRGNRILTLIVDGEPNVRLRPKAGWTVADDCFCPALVHPLRNDGSVDETALLPEEPIAADVRVKDAQPPREMRASERGQPDRRGLLDFMRLKLIAGLIGVGLDDLKRPEELFKDEDLQRENKRVSELMQQVQDLRQEVERLKTGAEMEKAERQQRESRQDKWDVFISAKSEDYPHARVVADFLRKAGLRVFFSEQQLPEMGNSDYFRAIDDALEGARHMLLVTTSCAHVNSAWVEKEWRTYLNEKLSRRKSGNLVTLLCGNMTIGDLPISLRQHEARSSDDLSSLLDYFKVRAS